MLESDLIIDLPSAETRRRLTGWDRMRAVFGTSIETRTGQEEINASALSVLTDLVEACMEVGVDDVVCVTVDGDVLYSDTEGRDGDLDKALAEVSRAGVLQGDPGLFVVVLDHRWEGLRICLAVRVRTRVPIGEEEVHIRISARIDALRPARGASPFAWSQAVARYDTAAVEAARANLEQWVARLAHAMKTRLACPVRVGDTWIRVTRIRPQEVSRSLYLPFGDQLGSPRYQPNPEYDPRSGFYDPFRHFLHDPYQDLLHLFALRAMARGDHWRSVHVRVVDPTGALVTTGDAFDLEVLGLEHEHTALGFDELGNLTLD